MTLIFFLVPAAKDAFKQLDKRAEEKIRVGDIQPCMKKLGHNVTGDWLESMEDEIDSEGEWLLGAGRGDERNVEGVGEGSEMR